MATAPAYRPDVTPKAAPASDSREESRPLSHEEPTTEEIAAEAYAIYMSRGSSHGNDLDDWLEAERGIKERRGARPTD